MFKLVENPHKADGESDWICCDIGSLKRRTWDEGTTAQLAADKKAFVEWGEEDCYKHFYDDGPLYRRICPQCWQELVGEVGE